MKPLKMDEVWRVLPPLDELRPVLDRLLARSSPDPDRTWSGSGELDTVGDRIVGGAAGVEPAELAADLGRHMEGVYRAVAEAVSCMARSDGAGAAAGFLEAARLEERRSRPDRALAYARSAHLCARGGRDPAPASRALRRCGRAARALGDLEEARARYAEAHEVAAAIADARGAAEAAIGAGNVLEDQGRWDEAATWYRRALDALDRAGPDADPAPERWQALLNLHIALRSRGDLDDSVPYLERAETVARAAGDASARPFLENARGQLETLAGDFAAAEARFRMALEVAPGPAAAVTVRLNLAEALLAQDRSLEAAEEARIAEADAVRAGVVPALPEVYRLLGRIAARNGNPDALVLFERALDIVRDRKLPALEEALTLQAYAEAEAARGENEAARHLHDQATRRYQALGIAHARHAWTDFFGPARGDPPGPASATPPESTPNPSPDENDHA